MDHPRDPVVHVHCMQTDELRVNRTVSHTHVHSRAPGRHANGPGLQGLRIHYNSSWRAIQWPYYCHNLFRTRGMLLQFPVNFKVFAGL